MTLLEKVAKLHFLQAILDPQVGGDAAALREVMAAVDFAITGLPETPATLDAFLDRAAKSLPHAQENAGFRVVDLRDATESPLWQYTRVRKALCALRGYPRAVLAIRGLNFHGPKRPRRGLSAEDRRAFIDHLAARLATPGTAITVLYL